jgi:hypothetical protein
VTMQPRSRTLLAWSLWVATFGCCAAGLAVTLATVRPLTVGLLAEGAARALAFPLGYATVGLVLTLRRPANPIGWLYAAAGLVWSAYIPFDPWVDQLQRTGRPVPLVARYLALIGENFWAIGIVLAIILPLLLLPDGRLRSPRWRPVAVAAIAATAVQIVAACLDPAPTTQTMEPLAKPFAVHGWPGTVAAVIGWTGFGIMFACVPAAALCAVLRYRLWDLDRLISRTVAYALVTALLLIPYLLILPAADRLAGGAGSLAVAAATLVAAAAFSPLRRRVQSLVDRRFNRRRYDAARTVDAFATRLRDQVDLDALHTELLGVVHQTMQPTRATLWLRPRADA